MFSTGILDKVEPQQQRDSRRAAEMKIVEHARAESRREAAALEQMKQHVREAFLSGAAATQEEFEQCWPELRNEMFRQRAKTAAQELRISMRQPTRQGAA